MIATQIALHDVLDIEGFVRSTIRRSGLTLELEEREELVAEGVCVLYELAERYEPRRNGHTQNGCFSGFAAQFLPRRLGDIWHSRHPEHRYTTTANGKRAWEYGQPPVTLDDDERPIVIAVADPSEQTDLTAAAIARLEPWERIDARRVVDLHDHGRRWSEIAHELDMTRDQLRALCVRLGQAMMEVRHDGDGPG